MSLAAPIPPQKDEKGILSVRPIKILSPEHVFVAGTIVLLSPVPGLLDVDIYNTALDTVQEDP